MCTLYTHSGDSANVVFARDGFVVGGVWVVAWGLGFGVAKQRVAKQLPTFVKTYSIHNDRASRLVDKIRPPVHTHTHTHTHDTRHTTPLLFYRSPQFVSREQKKTIALPPVASVVAPKS